MSSVSDGESCVCHHFMDRQHCRNIAPLHITSNDNYIMYTAMAGAIYYESLVILLSKDQVKIVCAIHIVCGTYALRPLFGASCGPLLAA